MADVLWRDTALTPKIFMLDARAVFPLALWLFHWAWWTAGLALAAIVALYLVHRHDSRRLLPRHPRGLHGTETRNAKH